MSARVSAVSHCGKGVVRVKCAEQVSGAGWQQERSYKLRVLCRNQSKKRCQGNRRCGKQSVS